MDRSVGQTAAMAFGQQAGPPASARQVQDLLTLLQEAGHADFREARGPMGFTQRQAGGRFTRDEATAFIERLHDTPSGVDAGGVLPAPERGGAGRVLRSLSDEQLAAELRRRGWSVRQP